jgi:peptidoglycan hydrolase CwlO-like protein
MRDASRGSALRRLRHAAGALFVVGLLAQLSPAPVVAGPHQTKEKLEIAERKVGQLQDDIRDARAQLDALNAEIQQIQTQWEQAQAQLAEIRRTIARTESAIERTTARITDLQGQLDQRARSAYIAGPAGALELILGARSLGDLSDRLTFLEHLNQRDSELATGLEVQRVQLRRTKGNLEDLEAQQADLVAQLAAQRDELQSKFAQQQEIAQRIADELAAVEHRVKTLKEKYQEELLAQLRAQQALAPVTGGGDIIANGGPFRVCPVDAPRSYSDSFGAPRYAGGYHPHAGNDLMAALGTPIRAPFDGTASVTSNGLGGNSVSVYGSEGYVYNAHLSEFGNLGHVSAGTIIGYVGNTGDAQGGPYHDHFEWHPNDIPSGLHESPYGYTVIGDAIDPYPYLNAVCGVNGSG